MKARAGTNKRRTASARPQSGRAGARLASLQAVAQGMAVGTLLVALATGGAWILRWLQSPTVFPIRQVMIEGSLAHLDRARLERIVDAHLQRGFFGVDLEAIARALKRSPWVAQARVRRVWPDALQIRIIARRAVAVWNGQALLDPSGRIFRPARNTWPQDLPTLAGPPGKEHELLQHYLSARRLFAQAGLRVTGLCENARRAYSLHLGNGIEVMIGRHWSLTRMARMLAVYRRLLAPRAARIARIDLRYPNGFAVGWKPAPPAGAGRRAKHG